MQLASLSVSTWPEGMEVHFAPEVESRLQQVAQANGKDAEQLVKDAVAHMLERQAIFVAGVNTALRRPTVSVTRTPSLRNGVGFW